MTARSSLTIYNTCARIIIMNVERNPIDRLEHKLDIEEAAAAAGALDTIASAKLRATKARNDALRATTPEDRLRAQIAGGQADLAQVHAMSAWSRAEWELHIMGNQE